MNNVQKKNILKNILYIFLLIAYNMSYSQSAFDSLYLNIKNYKRYDKSLCYDYYNLAEHNLTKNNLVIPESMMREAGINIYVFPSLTFDKLIK